MQLLKGFLLLFLNPCLSIYLLILEREKHQCEREALMGCLPYAPIHTRNGGPNLQLRYVPDQVLNLRPYGAWDNAPTNQGT